MLRLNVGFNRKTGEANYGSRGASVELALELESSLIERPDQLRERIRYLFGLAKASVEEELNGQQPVPNGERTEANDSGHANDCQRDGTRRATARQVRALYAIADRQQLDAAALLESHYGVDKPEDLSITEASELIDSLKAAGRVARGR
jgi:hypothetical protein